MPLTLYRRHRQDCEASRPEGSFSGEFEESRRGAKRCSCVIHASGTLEGKFNRKRTGCFKWDAAREVAARWEMAGAWNGRVAPAEPPLPETPRGVTIAEATEAYLAKCHNRGIQPATLNKYRTFAKQLRAYGEARGYVLINQLTVSDLDRFYASWKDGMRAKAKKLERLKSFVRFCVQREWLAKDIGEGLEAPEGASIPAHKTPFTDAGLERIHAACDALLPISPGPGHRGRSDADVKDFILFSIYTGLRISDVATFDITKRLKGNDFFCGCTRPARNSIPGYQIGWSPGYASGKASAARCYSARAKAAWWRPRRNYGVAGWIRCSRSPGRLKSARPRTASGIPSCAFCWKKACRLRM